MWGWGTIHRAIGGLHSPTAGSPTVGDLLHAQAGRPARWNQAQRLLCADQAGDDLETLSGQSVQHQRSYGCRVRLPPHLLHHRADEGAGGLDLAVTDLLCGVRVGCDGPVDRCFESP